MALVDGSAAGRTEQAARRIARLSAAIVVAVGVYGAPTIVPWWGNPLGVLVPQAYAVDGLVLVSVLALVLVGVAFPPRTELIGAGLERALVRVALLAGIVQCLAAVASLIGAFARPVGVGFFGIMLLLGCWHYRRRLYQGVGGYDAAIARCRAWNASTRLSVVQRGFVRSTRASTRTGAATRRRRAWRALLRDGLQLSQVTWRCGPCSWRRHAGGRRPASGRSAGTAPA